MVNMMMREVMGRGNEGCVKFEMRRGGGISCVEKMRRKLNDESIMVNY